MAKKLAPGSRSPAELKKHYAEYQGRPDQIEKRSQRNKARRLMEKEVGAKALKGKDVDHANPIRDGGGNARSNLRIQTPNKNRGWKRDA
jgi:5-methylcytosine-specific restriction endonuclease McrA